MDIIATAPALTLYNAKVVLADSLLAAGTVRVRDGLIDAVEPEVARGDVHDCSGDVLMPGIVDVHTDHFEKHVLPRPHVLWDPLRAALAHDAQIIGAGTTTVFDSLSVGSAEDDARRRDMLLPMMHALQAARSRGLFKADHLVHLRCEICDEATPRLLDEVVTDEGVAVASVMDHTPGVRQTRDLAHLVKRRAAASGRSERVEARAIVERRDAAADIVERVRPEVVARLKRTDLTLMSHDDTTADHVDEAHEDGFTIAEFPTSVEAAARARSHGMTIIAGAPNILLGGSQSRNVAVAELLARGLLDVLASDYVPRSILDAVFALAADDAFDLTLADTVRLATLAPARAVGLEDRGAIAPGQRADLVQVAVSEGQPFVRAVWREGRRVA